jgi:hypothetical protein
LRQQLLVLKRQVKRPAPTRRERILLVLVASRLQRWKAALVIVQPDTLIRWHRELFRRVWKRRSSSKAKPGRRPLADDVVALIIHMAKENRNWGAERIRGELLKLAVRVSKSTIQKYIRAVRLPRAPPQNWATFLRNHARAISEAYSCSIELTYAPLFRLAQRETYAHPSWLSHGCRFSARTGAVCAWPS